MKLIFTMLTFSILVANRCETIQMNIGHLIYVSLTACSIGKSFIIPSSVVAEEDRGGEGVEERNDEAPELESTEGGRSGFVK